MELYNALGKTWNEKCGTTAIGEHGRPLDRCLSYETRGQSGGKMRNVDAESNFFAQCMLL